MISGNSKRVIRGDNRHGLEYGSAKRTKVEHLVGNLKNKLLVSCRPRSCENFPQTMRIPRMPLNKTMIAVFLEVSDHKKKLLLEVISLLPKKSSSYMIQKVVEMPEKAQKLFAESILRIPFKNRFPCVKAIADMPLEKQERFFQFLTIIPKLFHGPLIKEIALLSHTQRKMLIDLISNIREVIQEGVILALSYFNRDEILDLLSDRPSPCSKNILRLLRFQHKKNITDIDHYDTARIVRYIDKVRSELNLGRLNDGLQETKII